MSETNNGYLETWDKNKIYFSPSGENIRININGEWVSYIKEDTIPTSESRNIEPKKRSIIKSEIEVSPGVYLIEIDPEYQREKWKLVQI